MGAFTIHLPNSLHDKIEELAKAEGLSVNQFMVTAGAEKIGGLLPVVYLT
ncbi:MAG: toxin-antitoxin system HicB family antitoxin, partial [Gemmatimonadetes bacterium]|nr:toxin-antitoxin system HicB family antitoxin [Gemmatimonadota bacterium]